MKENNRFTKFEWIIVCLILFFVTSFIATKPTEGYFQVSKRSAIFDLHVWQVLVLRVDPKLKATSPNPFVLVNQSTETILTTARVNDPIQGGYWFLPETLVREGSFVSLGATARVSLSGENDFSYVLRVNDETAKSIWVFLFTVYLIIYFGGLWFFRRRKVKEV